MIVLTYRWTAAELSGLPPPDRKRYLGAVIRRVYCYTDTDAKRLLKQGRAEGRDVEVTTEKEL